MKSRVHVLPTSEQFAKELELHVRSAKGLALPRGFARRRGLGLDVDGQLRSDRVERSDLGFQLRDAHQLVVTRALQLVHACA